MKTYKETQIEREKLKKEIIMTSGIVLFMGVMLIPFVLGYTADPKLPNLWDLFVDYTFGNFFVSVLGLAILIFLIVGPIGQISMFGTLSYTALFIYAMALGYGYPIISAGMFIFSITFLIFQVGKWISQ